MREHYHTDDEIIAVVNGFENCTTPKDQFTHQSHLTVATYYLCNSTADESFAKMRSGLLRFLNHHGVDPAKYNDHVTWAWIEQVQSVIEQMDQKSSMVEIANEVIGGMGDYRLPPDGITKTQH